MYKLSKYFKREEFACKCGCGFETVDTELLKVLEDLREYFGEPAIINCACRCDQHNVDVGGAKGSKHKLGIAADIRVKNVAPDKVYVYLTSKYPDVYGIGKYKTFTHIDVRTNAARWGG